ncbi:MAG: BREX system ATP-binding domain-containing protein [Persicimonas sp.]
MNALIQIADSTADSQTVRSRDFSPEAILEAMRLGVVPRIDLSAFTVGRDAQMRLVDDDLHRTQLLGGATRTFLGGYGTGKTHLLECIANRAIERGFVVSRAVLDPEETAPSHPKRVYRELVRSVEYPDCPGGRGRGLRPLFERALGSKEARDGFLVDGSTRSRDTLDDGAHLYLTPALRYFRALSADPSLGPEERRRALGLLFDWLEGHPTISNTEIDRALPRLVGRKGRIYSMMDYRPWARIYGYLLSGLSALVRRAGYRGLVVLVDEAEFYSLLGTQNRDYARTLFKALAWASLGADSGQLPFERTALDRGGLGILKELPPQYAPDAGLYTVFAMTPNSAGVDALSQAVPAHTIDEIDTLTGADYRTLAGRVCAHYRRAKPDTAITDHHEAALGDATARLARHGYVENPRQAMKFVVEVLDIVRFRPDAVEMVIEEIGSF